MKEYIYTENLYESVERVIRDTCNMLYFCFIIDNTGRIIYMNDTYCNYIGKPKSEIVGSMVKDIIPNTKLYDVLETGLPTFDDVFEYRDGRSLIYSRLPIKNSAGELLGVVSISSVNSTDTINNLHNEIAALERFNKMYSRQLQGLREAPSVFDNIVGESPKIIEIKHILSRVSNSSMPILLTGESGVGKEVFASAIHNASNRRGEPFVKVNCAAIPKDLMESELFGYEGGTFSGAIKGGRPGKFELANGGTILLDEIEELPLEMQSKLLRVLQEYEVERIGSVNPITLALQVICCSNKNLYKMVEDKTFREDLLYRINVMEIEIPPLRERPEDLEQLSYSLIEKINQKYKLEIASINSEAIEYLLTYNWPGNIRELEHAIERACVLLRKGVLSKHDFLFLEDKIRRSKKDNKLKTTDSFFEGKSYAERELIIDALKKNNGNRTAAAKTLGISRSLLYDKIKKYGI